MSLFSTFLLSLLAPWLAEKQSSQPEDFARQSIVISFPVFPTIVIRPQLFDAKSLLNIFLFIVFNGNLFA